MQPNTPNFPLVQEIKITSFPQTNISAYIEENRTDISFLAEEFQQRVLDFADFFLSFLREPQWCSRPPAGGAHQATVWRWVSHLAPTAPAFQLLPPALSKQVPRDLNISKKLISLFGKTFLVMNFSKNRIRTRLSPAWHLVHQNHCLWARPGLFNAIKIPVSPFTLVQASYLLSLLRGMNSKISVNWFLLEDMFNLLKSFQQWF